MAKRRTTKLMKVIHAVLKPCILIAGGIAANQIYKQNKMSPLQTGEIIAGIYSVKTGLVNLYLIECEGGYLAVDAGSNAKQTAAALAQLNIPADKVLAVLLTHSDGDHIAALSIFPNATVYLSAEEVQMIDGTTSRSPLGGNKLTVPYQTLSDGETVDLFGLSVECVLTPGHTPGSICYLINGKYLFTGDSISLNEGKAGLFNSFFNMNDEKQRSSLHMLAGMRSALEYIFTAHHGYCDDPASALEEWSR